MLALAANVVLLLGVSRLHALPFAAYSLAFVLSFNGTLAVKDKGAWPQAITRACAGVGAVLLVTVASLVEAWPLIGDLIVLAVIFGAVYLRRFGPRWTAVGMVGVMAYFMANYMRPAPTDLPWLVLTIALSLLITQFITTIVLRDDPAADFRRALGSLDQRIEMILRMMAHEPRLLWPKLQAQLGRMRDVVMMAEGLIPPGEDGGLALRGPAADLAIALFDLQLVVERSVRAHFAGRSPRSRLQAARSNGEELDGEGDGCNNLERMRQARASIDTALDSSPSPFDGAKTSPSSKTSPDRSWWKDPQLQVAVQVTIACSIAMAIGLATSPSRWYWAVITAFIVFNNTKSRADTAVRALQRSLGTIAGLVGGAVLATLLHGQMVAAAALMTVCFFLAFYYLQVSYSVMIFFITLALALLYGLTGSFSPELLELRLEETVIGALAGTLVAFFVFPVRTETGIKAALDKYLDALRNVVVAARGRALAEPEPLHLLARSRLLDRAYTDLATAVRPIGGPWAAVTRFGEVRARLLLLSGIAHWARVLTRSLPVGVKLDQSTRDGLLEAADDVSADIAAAAALEARYFDRPGEEHMQALRSRSPAAISDAADPVLALLTISALLTRATPATEATQQKL